MPVLHTQQSCSRDARPPVMGGIAFPWEGFIASAPPSSRFHTNLFLAMASQDLHATQTQKEENSARFRSNGHTLSKIQPRQQHPQRHTFLSTEVSSGSDSGLCGELQSLCYSGQLESALNLLLCAEERREFPSERVYRSLFKACRTLNDVKKVQAHLARRNLELSHPLGEVLVVTLLKCDDYLDALRIFNALPQRTVFSWSAVLSYYADCSKGLDALRLYGHMQQEGVEPNEYTFVALFKACGSIPDLEKGSALHAEARTRGFESSPFIANTLVSMYGKCGEIFEAESVFFGMLERNLVSWNAMLSAYVEQNEAENALKLYNRMQEECVNPNNRTLLFLLQACCLLADNEGAIAVNNRLIKVSTLKVAHKVHADIQIKGLETDIFVGNALMKLYGKCGSVGEAQGVFRGLPRRNVVSWNTLLSVFVEHGRSEKALRLYRQMQEEEGEIADERTFVHAIQACCSHSEKEDSYAAEGQVQKKLITLDIGQGLHADARRLGFASNMFLGNTLVALYGKCGSLEEAENVLAGMPQRDIVSWTAMLSGYVEQGKAEQALLLFRGIHAEGFSLDVRTLDIALQACGILLDREAAVLQGEPMGLHVGQALHFDAKRLAFCSDPFVTSSLVNLYGKCGCMGEAERTFTSTFQSAVAFWNVMLSTYNEQGEAGKALELYRQMQEEGINPDERTFVTALQSCCALAVVEATLSTEIESTSATLLEIGQSLHADARKRGFGFDPYISGALVSLYGKCGRIKEAENVFGAFSEIDTVLWNAMLLTYLEQGEAEKTLQLYGQMYKRRADLDKGTCVIALQAVCAIAEKEKASRFNKRYMKVNSLGIGEKLHTVAQGRGFDSDVFVGTTVLSMYSKCKCIEKAEATFDELPDRNIACWNTMLSAYIEQGLVEQALGLYKMMQEEGVIIDEITLTCLLQACSLLGNENLARHLHFAIVSAGCDTSRPLATALIHAYGNWAITSDAEAIFGKLSTPDAGSWNAIITGYALEKNTHASLATFQKMQEAKVQPTGLTFLSLLLACSHGGLVESGLAFFESMNRDYSINPELQHYVTVVQLLHHAGDYQRLKDILLNVPALEDPGFWLGLLSECQNYGVPEVVKLVLARAQHLKGSHPKAYEMLLSMHAGNLRLKNHLPEETVDAKCEFNAF